MRETINLTSIDGPVWPACAETPIGGDLVPTLASAELWGAGARGSDCFSMGFRTAEIQGLWFVFGMFEAAAIPASSDSAAVDRLAWGCFSATDFTPDFPPMPG